MAGVAEERNNLPGRQAPAGKGVAMFGRKSDKGYVEITGGVRVKTLVYGEQSLMAEFLLSEGAVLPEHSHPHEQTGYLVRGRIRLFVGAQSRLINPGDSWCIAADVPHMAEILDDSVAVEVFVPCRDEYRQYAVAADIS